MGELLVLPDNRAHRHAGPARTGSQRDSTCDLSIMVSLRSSAHGRCHAAPAQHRRVVRLLNGMVTTASDMGSGTDQWNLPSSRFHAICHCC
jgi:hypothetical protein